MSTDKYKYSKNTSKSRRHLRSIECDSETYKLDCPANYQIQGYSKAGFQTGFWVSGLNILLDCGTYTYRSPKAIFITHSHADHSWLLPYIITCRSNLTPVYMPIDAKDRIRNYLESTRSLHSDPDPDVNAIWKSQKCIPKTHSSNEKFRPSELPNIEVETLNCYHVCETIGFGFNTVTKKLKNEYVNLPKEELKHLKNNLDAFYELITPQFIFFGDTDIRALSNHIEWIKYPVIIIECTGYTDKEYDSGHISIGDLLPYFDTYRDKQWIIIHSGYTMNEELLTEVENKLRIDYEGIKIIIVK